MVEEKSPIQIKAESVTIVQNLELGCFGTKLLPGHQDFFDAMNGDQQAHPGGRTFQ